MMRCFLALVIALAGGLVLGAEPVITEAQMRAEYDRLVKNWPAARAGEIEYDVRHILVATREQADAALARIRSGERFEDVAKAVSADSGSAHKGGRLGWSQSTHFVKEFSDAMRALVSGGGVGAPVRTPFGWHLIEVLDVREPLPPPYEELKDRIERRLRDLAQKAR